MHFRNRIKLCFRLMAAFFALVKPSTRGAPLSRNPTMRTAFVSLSTTSHQRLQSSSSSFTSRMASSITTMTSSVSRVSPSIPMMMARKSSSAAAAADTLQEQEEQELIDPSTFMNGTIPYPTSLSPSAIMEFKKCPQSFLFQYLYRLKQPTNEALAKGSMCHDALDKIFDLDPPDRTLQHLQNLFRQSWAHHRLTKTYQDLFGTTDKSLLEYNETEEREWGQSALKLLENYYQVEDPRLVERPNPIQREIWLRADLPVNPSKGVTAHHHYNNDDDDNNTDTFHVRGIVDRLDMVKVSKSQVALRIVDYKTGKAPNFKYSQEMNEKIASEVFYQLKIYALLLRQVGAAKYASGGLDLRMLRLLFLTSESERGAYIDMDLGETQEERDVILQQVHQDLSNVWTSINELVATQDPKAFVGCDRSFCYCHKCRQQFLPGTVWEE